MASLFAFVQEQFQGFVNDLIEICCWRQPQHMNITVPPLDIGNRVAVGRPRTYRDRDRNREKSSLGVDAVLPN